MAKFEYSSVRKIVQCFSTLGTSSLVFKIHRGGTLATKTLHRRNLVIKAVVDYVNAEEAKKLVTAEGYTVLDVRDKTQYNRAHIKACHHVPLFIENEDSDLGKTCFLELLYV